MTSADISTAEPGIGTAAPRRVAPRKKRGNSITLGIVGWIVGIVFFFPVLWMVLTSFKTEAQAYTNTPSLAF